MTLPNKNDLVGDPDVSTYKQALGDFYDYAGDKGGAIDSHIANLNNPHGTTAAQVGAVALADLVDTATAGKAAKYRSDGRLAGDITGNAPTATLATTATLAATATTATNIPTSDVGGNIWIG